MSQNSGKPTSSDGNNNVAATAGGFRLPSTTCMQHASKLAIVEDRPIMLDYWTQSIEKKVIIGVKENGEKLLVKSEEEYTSPIGKIFKIESEYIILTENSIYIVSSDIQSNRIN